MRHADIEDDFDLSPLVKDKSKRKNSKKKGNAFENKIAKIFNERFNTTEFCRSPGSGAFGTTHKLPQHMQVYGDLITPEKFKGVIEIKKGYNSEKFSNLFNPKSLIYDFINQAEKDLKRSNKEFFLLIIGQDNLKPVVLFERGMFMANYSIELTLAFEFKLYTMVLLSEFLDKDDFNRELFSI